MRHLLPVIGVAIALVGCSGGEPPSQNQAGNSGVPQANGSSEVPIGLGAVNQMLDPTTAKQRRSELDMIAADMAFVGKTVYAKSQPVDMRKFPVNASLTTGNFYASIGPVQATPQSVTVLFVPIWNEDDPAFTITIDASYATRIEPATKPAEYSSAKLRQQLGLGSDSLGMMAALAEGRNRVRTGFGRIGKAPDLSAVNIAEVPLPGGYKWPDSYEHTATTATLTLVPPDSKAATIAQTFNWASGETTYVVAGRNLPITYQALSYMTLVAKRLERRKAAISEDRKTIESRVSEMLAMVHVEAFRSGRWPAWIGGIEGSALYDFAEYNCTSRHRLSVRLVNDAGEPELLIQEFGSDVVCRVRIDAAQPSKAPEFSWSE